MSQPDNEQYWIDRHRDLKGRLEAVGKIGMSQEWNESAYRRKRDRMTAMLGSLKLDLSGRDVLDAGCGVGMMSRLFADLGGKVQGIDVSPDGIEQARARCPEGAFSVTSLVDFALGKKFDAIFCIDVLYHVVDDSNWRRVLGNFVIHAKPNARIVIVDQVQPEASRPADHVRFRTQAMYDDAFRGFNATPVHDAAHSFALIYQT